ncbi:helix-turn-helix domain-containing protein [Saccharophagus degradans]|uniref:helix-turn-helix domain-containing protein n=1 Tax=Saccharophagus degradans TaxID=86304 RepID=UPI001C08132F|nr:helix-turn-helix domain-containing protein [Saccharophagus degradans]
MIDLYYKSIAYVIALSIFTLALGGMCFYWSHLNHALMPAENSRYPWQSSTLNDAQEGGASIINIIKNSHNLNFNYLLIDKVEYPFVAAVIAFDELEGATTFVDLRKYSTLRMNIRCSQKNVLSFFMHSDDLAITDRSNFSSYRISEVLIPCDIYWAEVEVDLHHLYVPPWWLHKFGLEHSDQSYSLSKVLALSFAGSHHGPVNKKVEVSIQDIRLQGKDWRYMWAFTIIFLLAWGAVLLWLLKLYTRSLVSEIERKITQARPLVAYKKISIAPHKEDSLAATVLRFFATEYSNPAMSLEYATEKLNINRNKLNGVLKQELNLTFNAYLHKLRMVEAGRLLDSDVGISVSELAFRLGYTNTNYFYKVFKNEYGCTPKKYKDINHSSASD